MSAKVPHVKPRDTRRNGPQYAGMAPLQPPRKWTQLEDELLRRAVEEIGARHWKQVAERVPGRNHVQCLQRYLRVLQPGLKKGHWTPEEDEKLRSLASKGFTTWNDAAEQIPGRSAKQCRDRWRNHLASGINHGPWEPAEDALLLELHAKHGNRWAAIARMMPGRTENAVKIHCKSLLGRQPGSSVGPSNNSEDDTKLDEEDEEARGGNFFDKLPDEEDSEDDAEATTDDLSSISPLPSPMGGYSANWNQPWKSSSVPPQNTQASQSAMRTSRLQSFSAPILASNIMIRRSSFPGAQVLPASLRGSVPQASFSVPALDISAASFYQETGAAYPAEASISAAPSPSHGVGAHMHRTFNGAVPRSELTLLDQSAQTM